MLESVFLCGIKKYSRAFNIQTKCVCALDLVCLPRAHYLLGLVSTCFSMSRDSPGQCPGACVIDLDCHPLCTAVSSPEPGTDFEQAGHI